MPGKRATRNGRIRGARGVDACSASITRRCPQVSVSSAFDHFTTAFPLEGAHQFAHCESCHVDGQFAGTPVQCAGCHSQGSRVRATFQPRAPRPHDRVLRGVPPARRVGARRRASITPRRSAHAAAATTTIARKRQADEPRARQRAMRRLPSHERVVAGGVRARGNHERLRGLPQRHDGDWQARGAHSGRQHLRGLPPHDDVLARHAGRSPASDRRLLELPQRHHRSRAARGPHPDASTNATLATTRRRGEP